LRLGGSFAVFLTAPSDAMRLIPMMLILLSPAGW
jgi:hypothetical protein